MTCRGHFATKEVKLEASAECCSRLTRSLLVQDERQVLDGQVDGDKPGTASNVRRELDLLPCGDGYKSYTSVHFLAEWFFGAVLEAIHRQHVARGVPGHQTLRPHNLARPIKHGTQWLTAHRHVPLPTIEKGPTWAKVSCLPLIQLEACISPTSPFGDLQTKALAGGLDISGHPSRFSCCAGYLAGLSQRKKTKRT